MKIKYYEKCDNYEMWGCGSLSSRWCSMPIEIRKITHPRSKMTPTSCRVFLVRTLSHIPKSRFKQGNTADRIITQKTCCITNTCLNLLLGCAKEFSLRHFYMKWPPTQRKKMIFSLKDVMRGGRGGEGVPPPKRVKIHVFDDVFWKSKKHEKVPSF